MQCVPSVGEKGKFSISPITGSPAEKAGLRKGDLLVWINGAMACELTHSAINKMVGMYKCLFSNCCKVQCINLHLLIWQTLYLQLTIELDR